MTYGDRADLGRGVSEVFAPGSLRPESPTINVKHDPGRIVSTTPEIRERANRVEVEFDASAEVRAMVRNGLDRMSIEFRSLAERFDTSSFTREIREAALTGVALVEQPAYRETAVELRGAWKKAAMTGGRKRRDWARGRIPTKTKCDCECIAPVTTVVFEEQAFQPLVQRVNSGAWQVLAIIGNRGPHNVVASTLSGMRLSLAATGGDLRFTIDDAAANTPAGKSLVDADALAPVVARPLIDHDDPETVYRDEGEVRIYRSAIFRTLLLKYAADRAGWLNLFWWIPDPDDPPAPGQISLPWWANPAELV